MDSIASVLGISVYNNTIEQYTTAAIVFFASILVLSIVKSVVIRRILLFTEKTKYRWDNYIVNIINTLGWPLYIVIAVYFASHYLELNDFTHTIIAATASIVVVFYAVKAIQKIVERSINIYIQKRAGAQKVDKTIVGFITTLTRFILWIVAILIVLQNLGFNVTVLLGGLGVAGIAIGFALQNVLSDFFAFFSIYFDKPFERGDFIVVGQDKGTVEHIGIKSTRIRTVQGEEMIISNQELTSARVSNFKKMEKRRGAFTFGVTYETPNTKLKKIPGIVKKILKEEKLAEIDRVHFIDFGESALNFEVVYFMLDKDFKKYRDAQQRINFKLKEAFEKEKIDFAYPTQMVYVAKTGESTKS